MNEYIKGQEDLIKHIALEVARIAEENNDENVVIDVMNLLRNLKPIEK